MRNSKIFVLLLIPLLVIIFYGYIKEFIIILKHVTYANIMANGFYFSFPISFIGAYLFIGQSSYFSILKHELIHNLFALFTLNKPHALVVKKGQGGTFSYSGDGNVFITLSPYFFPLLSFCWIPVSLLSIKDKFYYLGILGVLFGIDAATSLKDIHLKQSDFRHYGLFFSMIFIALAMLICWGCTVAFAQNGFQGTEKFLIRGGSNVILETCKLFHLKL